MKKIALAVATCVLAAATPASAATMVFTDNPTTNSTDFAAAVAARGGSVITNATFDQPTTGAVVTSTGSVSQANGAGPGQGNTSFAPLSSGEGTHLTSNYLELSDNSSVLVNFVMPTFGVGLSTLDLFNPTALNPVTLSAFAGVNGTGTLIGTATAASFNFQRNNLYFLGILSDSANINSLVFNSFGSRSGDILGVDNVVSASPSVRGAVPEPSTWLMMILGFGIVGWNLRSRRKQAFRSNFA